MRGHLDHVDGHGETCALPLPFETLEKNNLQGVGSSLSYGRRYALINLCSIISHAATDRDTDGSTRKIKTCQKTNHHRWLTSQIAAEIHQR